MAYVYYRNMRRPNEVSVTIAGSKWAISAAIERLEREGNEVMGIIPPPTDTSFKKRTLEVRSSSLDEMISAGKARSHAERVQSLPSLDAPIIAARSGSQAPRRL